MMTRCWSVVMYSPAAVSYRVLAPFVVIQPFSHRPPFVTIPRGSIIETREEIRSPGLCEITLDHRPLLAFMRDIEQCAEPLHASVGTGDRGTL